MRKELRGIAIGTPANIIDSIVSNTGFAQLVVDQPGKIAMRLVARTVDGVASGRCIVDLLRDLFANLECVASNVGPDRNDEFVRASSERLDCIRDDVRDGTAPSRMHRRNVSTRRMRQQDGHTVGGPHRHTET